MEGKTGFGTPVAAVAETCLIHKRRARPWGERQRLAHDVDVGEPDVNGKTKLELSFLLHPRPSSVSRADAVAVMASSVEDARLALRRRRANMPSSAGGKGSDAVVCFHPPLYGLTYLNTLDRRPG